MTARHGPRGRRSRPAGNGPADVEVNDTRTVTRGGDNRDPAGTGRLNPVAAATWTRAGRVAYSLRRRGWAARP